MNKVVSLTRKRKERERSALLEEVYLAARQVVANRNPDPIRVIQLLAKLGEAVENVTKGPPAPPKPAA